MSSIAGIRSQAIRFCDQTLLVIEDAIHWCAAKLGISVKHEPLTQLNGEDVYFADVKFSTKDPIEALAAMRLQIARHSPISIDELTYSLARVQGANDCQIAMARTQRLEELASENPSAGYLANSPQGHRAVLRLSNQWMHWRRRWLLRLAAAFLICVSLLVLAAGLADWAERRAAAFSNAETVFLAEASELRDALNARSLATDGTSRIGLDRLSERLTLAIAAAPESWAFRHYEGSAERITLIFEEAEGDAVTPSQWTPVFREALDTNEIAIARHPAGGARSQIRVTVLYQGNQQ